ncbi:MAG: hypothetical protein F6J97_14630 [Leptolyngbya sp. SIO4C1]|nr:hypothetical protein [Leptolyngbya sp. SIO4C1]
MPSQLGHRPSKHCSLCHDQLLRHVCRSRIYWFCPSCRQEMPGTTGASIRQTRDHSRYAGLAQR